MNATDSALTGRFRDVMSTVCSQVTVITAAGPDRPHGTTVSAFTSLSLDPPMVLVSLDKTSELLSFIRATGRFGVNVMGREQSALAMAFARKGDQKFHGVRWTSAWGLPRLDGAPGWLACAVASLVFAGDHVIVLGDVLDADARLGEPLTYHSRAFGTHSPLESAT
jgi:flavin reductase (DIM6/NTAB) family NADH-FMN oxidoreductase RutF